MDPQEYAKLPDEHPFKKHHKECMLADDVGGIKGCNGLASMNNEVATEVIRRTNPDLLKVEHPKDRISIHIYGLLKGNEYRVVNAMHTPFGKNGSEWSISSMCGTADMRDQMNAVALEMGKELHKEINRIIDLAKAKLS